MRSRDEIQRAHDVLVAYVLGEIRHASPSPETLAGVTAALDALCWVLQHDHVVSFGTNLARLEAFVEESGGTFQRIN